MTNLGFVGLFNTVLLKFRKYHKIVYSYYPFMFSVSMLGMGLVLYINFGIFYSFFFVLCFFFVVCFFGRC